MPKDETNKEWAPAPAASLRAVSPLDIQQKEFSVARFGGYKMREVDEFLDELTESMSALSAENERLRRQAGSSPVVGSPDLDDVSRQADEIIQRARDEAARIVAEAKGRAGGSTASAEAGPTNGGPDAADAVQGFLAQERAFLQDLAGLVQGHVDAVKGMARTAPRAPANSATEAEPPATARDEQVAGDAAPDGAGSGAEGEQTREVPKTDEPIRLEEPKASKAGTRRGDEGDDSLRELFWGEED